MLLRAACNLANLTRRERHAAATDVNERIERERLWLLDFHLRPMRDNLVFGDGTDEDEFRDAAIVIDEALDRHTDSYLEWGAISWRCLTGATKCARPTRHQATSTGAAKLLRNARGETRTRKPFTRRGILSPLRLPIPPPGRVAQCTSPLTH